MLTLIRELGVEGAFDSETVRIMATAFDRARATVQSSGAPFSESDYTERVREILGKSIVMAAKSGSRDEQQLCDGALLELARSDLRGARASSRPSSSQTG